MILISMVEHAMDSGPASRLPQSDYSRHICVQWYIASSVTPGVDSQHGQYGARMFAEFLKFPRANVQLTKHQIAQR